MINLCLTSLKEIQQQRAAQKMMTVFNQVKPEDMQHSPRCVCVCLSRLLCVHLCVSVPAQILFSVHQVSRCVAGPLAFKWPVADY